MTNQQKLRQLFSILSEAEVYQRSMGKLNFDMMCCAPEEGLTQAGEDISVLGRQLHKLTHSKKYQRLVRELYADSEGLTQVQRRLELNYPGQYEWEKGVTADGKEYYSKIVIYHDSEVRNS